MVSELAVLENSCYIVAVVPDTLAVGFVAAEVVWTHQRCQVDHRVVLQLLGMTIIFGR